MTDNFYETDLEMDKLPQHVAIIMDGNGRWATRKKSDRLFGHYNGVESVRQCVELCDELNMPYLTIYAFSTENWKRPETEVKGLMKLIMESLIKEVKSLNEHNINVHFIGSDLNLPPKYRDRLDEVSQETWTNTGLHFTIAMNYGGRREILDAMQQLYSDVKAGIITSEIGENTFSKYLYTADMPDVDLVIRTSGEMRLSNFLLWQSAYAEFWVTDTLWPDFRKKHLVQAIAEYQKRQRRYGGV